MTMRRRRSWMLSIGLVIVAAACGSTVPSPSPPSPAASTPPAAILDDCDPAGVVPCNQQAAFLSIPIADTGLDLTWSSLWAQALAGGPRWDAHSIGLGGWSLDVVGAENAAAGIVALGESTGLGRS